MIAQQQTQQKDQELPTLLYGLNSEILVAYIDLQYKPLDGKVMNSEEREWYDKVEKLLDSGKGLLI